MSPFSCSVEIIHISLYRDSEVLGEDSPISAQPRLESFRGDESTTPARPRLTSQRGDDSTTPARPRLTSQRGDDEPTAARPRLNSFRGDDSTTPARPRLTSQRGDDELTPARPMLNSLPGDDSIEQARSRRSSLLGDDSTTPARPRLATDSRMHQSEHSHSLSGTGNPAHVNYSRHFSESNLKARRGADGFPVNINLAVTNDFSPPDNKTPTKSWSLSPTHANSIGPKLTPVQSLTKMLSSSRLAPVGVAPSTDDEATSPGGDSFYLSGSMKSLADRMGLDASPSSASPKGGQGGGIMALSSAVGSVFRGEGVSRGGHTKAESKYVVGVDERVRDAFSIQTGTRVPSIASSVMEGNSVMEVSISEEVVEERGREIGASAGARGEARKKLVPSEAHTFSLDEIMTIIAVSDVDWGRDPLHFICPYCSAEGYSVNHLEHSAHNWVGAAALCAIGCWFG